MLCTKPQLLPHGNVRQIRHSFKKVTEILLSALWMKKAIGSQAGSYLSGILMTDGDAELGQDEGIVDEICDILEGLPIIST